MKTTRTKKSIVKQAKEVIDQVSNDLSSSEKTVKRETTRKTSVKKKAPAIQWDFPLESDVSFFDANLSYELSGYRPINKTQGLDFDPNWFLDARNAYIATGHYTSYLPGSKLSLIHI